MKVFSWHPGLTYALFYLFGPENFGGKENIHPLVENEARRTGRPYKEVGFEVHTDGALYPDTVTLSRFL